MVDDQTCAGRSAKFKYEVKDFSEKSTTHDINASFDAAGARLSNLETGQSAMFDAPLSMHLITEAALRLTPKIASRCCQKFASIGVALVFVDPVRDNRIVGTRLASIDRPPRPATRSAPLGCTNQSSEQSGQV